MHTGKKRIQKPVKVMFTIFLSAYLLLLVYLTFFSQFYGRTIVHRSINIIPMRTILEFLTCEYGTKAVITNLAGNIAAFMPMGFLLPIVFIRFYKLDKVLIAALLASLIVEILQYAAGVGASDIDDVILNVTGAILGYCIYRLLRKWFYKQQRH